tara:strand:- start:81 stop:572 length:492 start_codon:yes stop_codon:yes gene_type:complete
MASIRVSFDIKKAKAKIKKKQAFMERRFRQRQQEVADDALEGLKSNTPSLTGKTRAAWKKERARGAGGRYAFGYKISNDKPTMIWLEDGTKAHGPVTAPRLYVPRSAAARKGYRKGLKWGRDFVMADRVRGIKPHNIVKRQLGITQGALKSAWKQTMREAKRI